MLDSDLRQLAAAGLAPPSGEVVAVRTPDFETKELRIEEIAACFDIPHFATYTGVLVLLDDIDVDDLRELVEDSWLAVAPRRAITAWRAEQGR